MSQLTIATLLASGLLQGIDHRVTTPPNITYGCITTDSKVGGPYPPCQLVSDVGPTISTTTFTCGGAIDSKGVVHDPCPDKQALAFRIVRMLVDMGLVDKTDVLKFIALVDKIAGLL